MDRENPIDPFEMKRMSKLHPYRMAWTGFSRMLDFYGRVTHKPISKEADGHAPTHLFEDRGADLPDTAVTSNQLRLLELALNATEKFSYPIVEVGCYRGVTTRRLGGGTVRDVYAVDPYIGYGGWEADLDQFNARVGVLSNVIQLRLTSGRALQHLSGRALSLVFIDAVHDYSNSWFDFKGWSTLLQSGGIIALHDVDDFHGVNMTCRRILAKEKSFMLWGYCPNLALFMKVAA
jgi:predicted O-methyltransferase YrrM